MPTFSADTREALTPSLVFPVSEVLSSYLAMTAPTRSRAGARAEGRTAPGPRAAGSDESGELRAAELWDALGDFA